MTDSPDKTWRFQEIGENFEGKGSPADRPTVPLARPTSSSSTFAADFTYARRLRPPRRPAVRDTHGSPRRTTPTSSTFAADFTYARRLRHLRVGRRFGIPTVPLAGPPQLHPPSPMISLARGDEPSQQAGCGDQPQGSRSLAPTPYTFADCFTNPRRLTTPRSLRRATSPTVRLAKASLHRRR